MMNNKTQQHPPVRKPTVKVCFKKDRKSGEIVASLPEKRGGSLMVSCYTHNEQHSMCSKGYITSELRNAEEKEYAQLLNEMKSIYKDCNLSVLKRLPPFNKL